jgi:hypothetical protein
MSRNWLKRKARAKIVKKKLEARRQNLRIKRAREQEEREQEEKLERRARQLVNLVEPEVVEVIEPEVTHTTPPKTNGFNKSVWTSLPTKSSSPSISLTPNFDRGAWKVGKNELDKR